MQMHCWLRITSSSPRLNGARATLRASTWGRHLIWRAATASFAGLQKNAEFSEVATRGGALILFVYCSRTAFVRLPAACRHR